ncbi:hypothetical protein BU23DRAFT_560970 [Bimuria novae-zelandiae CBS 107.79]|uniref:Uncharacterized protein n=1 Tax=Bimuria novae-zelandiae CBS 107.79 TaxID=1447943 RepID=A0A6A5UKY4_9PLEO|nr:hypothetical protein BU23DRAFT_560970 [Bimuria novae-zelandiae CBS 107.79]
MGMHLQLPCQHACHRRNKDSRNKDSRNKDSRNSYSVSKEEQQKEAIIYGTIYCTATV